MALVPEQLPFQVECHEALTLCCFALLGATAERGAAVQWRGAGLPLARLAECPDHPASIGLNGESMPEENLLQKDFDMMTGKRRWQTRKAKWHTV